MRIHKVPVNPPRETDKLDGVFRATRLIQQVQRAQLCLGLHWAYTSSDQEVPSESLRIKKNKRLIL